MTVNDIMTGVAVLLVAIGLICLGVGLGIRWTTRLFQRRLDNPGAR